MSEHYSTFIYKEFKDSFNKKHEETKFGKMHSAHWHDGVNTGVVDYMGVAHKVTITPIKTQINVTKILKFTQLMRMGGAF